MSFGKPLASDLILGSKSIIINRVGSDYKIDRAKTKAKHFYRENRKMAKSKIIVRPENYLSLESRPFDWAFLPKKLGKH